MYIYISFCLLKRISLVPNPIFLPKRSASLVPHSQPGGAGVSLPPLYFLLTLLSWPSLQTCHEGAARHLGSVSKLFSDCLIEMLQ